MSRHELDSFGLKQGQVAGYGKYAAANHREFREEMGSYLLLKHVCSMLCAQSEPIPSINAKPYAAILCTFSLQIPVQCQQSSSIHLGKG